MDGADLLRFKSHGPGGD